MDAFAAAYRGKRVLITGHTGFKGAWLSEWLLGLGAEVWGFSLPPPTRPALFEQLGLASRLKHQLGDVRDAAAVCDCVRACRPDYVFHLAAQSLVRAAYADPAGTYATNVTGTIQVLEALREVAHPCAAVFVTSDKCYVNRNQAAGYVEDDPLGGADPYSSSKAAAEVAIASWRKSFFAPGKIAAGGVPSVAIASVRAGNVLGGGDWAADRLVPDCVRALQRGETIAVRNPAAVRPWQHVLEPLSGYLQLAARLRGALVSGPDATALARFASAFNFGPAETDARPVRELVTEVLRHWPGQWEEKSEVDAPEEAGQLRLNSARAAAVLEWHPRWHFSDAVRETVTWYRAVAGGADAAGLVRAQIQTYSALGGGSVSAVPSKVEPDLRAGYSRT